MLWQRCLPWGMLGKSKSLNDDTGMVVADGHLEEDRELIALEQYMGDAWEQEKQLGCLHVATKIAVEWDVHINAVGLKPSSLSRSTVLCKN